MIIVLQDVDVVPEHLECKDLSCDAGCSPGTLATPCFQNCVISLNATFATNYAHLNTETILSEVPV